MDALGGYGMWHVFYVAQVPEIAMQGAICLAGAIAIFCRCVSIAQPTIRRLNASSTTARYRKPATVGT